jgi:O-antigen ligase
LISASRFHVFWSAVELIRDVPFTGGGLDSFPGLYSTYIMINPNYILGYSHNIYLDAVLQLGILGGLMLCWIIIGSIVYLAVRSVPEEHSLLRYAILSSLLISVFRGLVDNIVLRTMFTTLLFFVPGMAVGLLSSTNPKPDIARHEKAISRHLAIAILTVLCLVLLGYAVCYKSVWSAWYTDLGCVKMAKIQLANFPTSTWDEGKQTNLLQPAESLFSQALVYDPTNPRAHYRLGLIALLNRDFTNAIYHLKIANRGDPYHRGIIKALGYSYLWDGQFVAARSFLSLLPESNQEIAVYSWWWGQQQRPDLSANAAQYLKLVENSR